MRILVCVKQVPSVMEVRLNETTKRLDRGAVESGMNVFDLYALEAAARLKDAMTEAVHITALCMGPESAKTILRDALALAADEAYLVSDERFAGSDLRATASILKNAIHTLEKQNGAFDLICMGRASTDGWEKTESGAFLLAEQEGETEDDTREVEMPCVLSFTKASYAVRYPDFARTIEAEKTEIPVLDANMLFETSRLTNSLIPASAYTSRTQVRAFRYHPVKKSGHVITGAPENVAAKLWKALAGKGVL